MIKAEGERIKVWECKHVGNNRVIRGQVGFKQRDESWHNVNVDIWITAKTEAEMDVDGLEKGATIFVTGRWQEGPDREYKGKMYPQRSILADLVTWQGSRQGSGQRGGGSTPAGQGRGAPQAGRPAAGGRYDTPMDEGCPFAVLLLPLAGMLAGLAGMWQGLI